jgi:hypothetical protein
MDQQKLRRTFKYQLKPTLEQERELGRVLGLCRWLYNTALEQRVIAYHRAGVSLSRYQQEAEVKAIRRSFQSTPPSTATSCKTCWRGSTAPIRHSFVG